MNRRFIMTFADKVLALRKKSGLTQEELAEKLEVSRQAISRWEMGLAMPDASNLLQLSKLFKVTIDYLINDEYSSDDDIPIVKNKEASLNKEMKKVSAMIKSTLIGLAISVILALSLFPFNAELPVLVIPIIALPFPAFYLSVFYKELKSLKLIGITSAILLLAVNVITIIGFWVSFNAHHGEAYVHFILWDNVICFMNAAALLSFGSFVAFSATLKKWWGNLLMYLLISVLWIGISCILYSITSDNFLSPIIPLAVGALLCIVGGIAYVLQTKKAKEYEEV